MSVGIRNARIDVLRGVSILLVLLHHFDIAYPLARSPLGDVLTPALTRAICRNGNYAVTMFFTISGFLITSNALRRWGSLARISPAGFYLRRVARILPCLMLLLAVVNGLGLSGIPIFGNQPEYGPSVSFARADLAALTFSMNLLMAQAGWFNYCLGVLWSLSVEEMFYLAFPVLCRALRRTTLLAAFWVLVVVAGPLYRAAHQSDEAYFLYAYPACFDAIALGCLAAVLLASSLVSRPSPWLQRIAALLMVSLYLWRPIADTNVWGASLISLGAAVLLLGAEKAPPTSHRRPGSRGLRWLGRHSYELYLFHLVALAALRIALPPAQATPGVKPVWLLLYLLLSATLAALVARLVAEPANRTIRRLSHHVGDAALTVPRPVPRLPPA